MLSSLFRVLFRSRVRAFAGIPGPTPWFPLGTALDFVSRRQPWEICADYATRYGGLTLIWLGGKPALVLNDPKLIGAVLETNWDRYYKDAPVKALEPVITRGSLFISNPPAWKAGRAQNPLSMPGTDNWLADQVEPLQRVIAADLADFASRSKREPIDLYRDMQRLSFHAFAQAFWGEVLDESAFRWFQALARTGSRRMMTMLPLFPPINPLFLYCRKRWYDTFTQKVREARRAPDPAAVDLLHVTLRAGTELSDSQLAEALATNFFGGVFSASSTLNTSLYLLARHSGERDKLAAALEQASTRRLDWDSLPTCRPLDYVLREAMRYYPAVPLYFRNVSRDQSVELDGHKLPPNTLLFLTNWHLHRQSAHWGDPDVFRPDRWANGVAERNPIGSDYFFPFGRGPRMCIGMPFAMFFMKLALATILRETRVDFDPTQPYRQSFFFGVMMPKGLKARFFLNQP